MNPSAAKAISMKAPEMTATPAARNAMTKQTAENKAAITWTTDRRMRR